MQDALLEYYERELTVFRQLGQEFAQAYPKVAGRLLLETNKCEDPHVERLIQAVAFLAARIHKKIDDELPEITSALLGILYPHYLAPIPSMSVAQFILDPEQGKLTSGYSIPRGTSLYSRPINDTQCRFRTCYPVTLWPVTLTAARFEPSDQTAGVKAIIRLELQCQGGITFRELQVDSLRFYLHGESQLAHAVYELLLNNTSEVRVRSAGGKPSRKATVLSSASMKAVGFASDEGMLPYPPHALLGYRLLQEYFTFPQKFLFFDLTELKRATEEETGDKLEVMIALDRPPRPDHSISAANFQLGCTPIVNLFDQNAEPIRIDHTQHEYRVIPNVRQQHVNEIYAIDAVTWTSPQAPGAQPVHPIYSLKHAGTDEKQRAFWFGTRRPSEKKGDSGTEMFISLVDVDFNPKLPAAETLIVQTTCSNRDLPENLPVDDVRGDFELEGAAPVSRIRSLVKPTPPVRPPLRGESQWRLISHLSLNFLSLGTGGPEALQEILRLYDFSDSAVVRQQIAGVMSLTTKRVVRRPSAMGWHGFCRGLEVTIGFDEEKYVGSGVFLFATVLEKFLGLYASLNSFTQLVATTKQRERLLKRWPPRAGEQILL